MLASGSFGAAAFLNDGFLATQGFDKLLHFETENAICKMEN